MPNNQSDRLTSQQTALHGAEFIFNEDSVKHDRLVGAMGQMALVRMEQEFPSLEFRLRPSMLKSEINTKLRSIDPELGQTLFLTSSSIRPDGGILEVKDDRGKWRVVLVSEAKHQGKDIENIRAGKKVGKNRDQDLMAAGNAIERAYKNVQEIANYMLDESYFPYVIFLEGSNFLTKNVTVVRPNGDSYTIQYDSGILNRLDRLTAANYGMPLNTNLCENRFIKTAAGTIMLQAASIYTQGDGAHWNPHDMLDVMHSIARTSLRMLSPALFDQLNPEQHNNA